MRAETFGRRARRGSPIATLGASRAGARALGLATVLTLVAAGSVAGASSITGPVKAGVNPCTEQSPVAPALGEPFGFFDGRLHPGDNAITGVQPIFGWALDDDGVAAVDVLVDGAAVGRARYGQTRADVGALFPGFPDGALSGWQFDLDSTNFLNGEHVVSAQVVSVAGEVRQLNARVFQFSNNTHNLRPFGLIEFPNPNADVFGVCDVGNPSRRYTVVTGWALDAGVETNDHGIGYVELLIDGAFYANSRLDCEHSPVTGAHTNCYGVRRLDVESVFPTLKDGPNAGFRFVVDVGALIALDGYSEGHHTFTIRAGDVDSQVANVDSIPVDFFCEGGGISRGSFGSIDESPERPRAAGELEISGWALDADGVSRVQIHVDGQFAGDASYGFPRAQVTSLHPGFPDSAAPGWIFTLDTRDLSQGGHSIQVLVTDLTGSDDLIGEVSFLVGNP